MLRLFHVLSVPSCQFSGGPAALPVTGGVIEDIAAAERADDRANNGELSRFMVALVSDACRLRLMLDMLSRTSPAQRRA